MSSSTLRVWLGLGTIGLLFCSAVGLLAARAVERQMDSATVAPDFSLPEVDGQWIALSSLRGSTGVLIFCSAHEAQSNRYSDRIVRLAARFEDQDKLRILPIDPKLNGATPFIIDELQVYKKVIGQDFPMLLDIGGKVAAQYGVQTLPTAVVVDRGGQIRYVGPFDDHPGETQLQQHYCETAVFNFLEEEPATAISTQAFGYRSR